MSLKQETVGTAERCKDGNDRRHDSGSAILRKRIKATFAIVLTALVYAIYIYYRSTYLRNAGDWSWFWVGEAFIGVWLVYAVAQALRKEP
jgi:1,4-dihydroxy-2-naphthoate octaprenyltransferase